MNIAWSPINNNITLDSLLNNIGQSLQSVVTHASTKFESTEIDHRSQCAGMMINLCTSYDSTMIDHCTQCAGIEY